MELKNKVTLITGATAGIGAEAAMVLALEAARISRRVWLGAASRLRRQPRSVAWSPRGWRGRFVVETGLALGSCARSQWGW